MSTHTGPREWDAEIYDRVSDLQFEWGMEVLRGLPLEGSETVLDAGCGSGRLTEELAARLPAGRVLAVDASSDMVRKARERLGDRAVVWQVDLTELELEAPVDAVFSTAVFHWIADHERLFDRLHMALAPGGRLAAQCGGKRNVASLARVLRSLSAEDPYAHHLQSFGGIWNFATAEETADRLDVAGFTEIGCWLESKSVRPDHPHDFLRTVTLGPHLARLPESLREPFVQDVLARLGEPLELDYVRLNIDARSRS